MAASPMCFLPKKLIFNLGIRAFFPGQRGVVDLPSGRLVSHGELTLRLHVFRALRL